ncbi:MAG: hypothetical protein WC876_07165 [Candidatus Thermoplasmatota archaeon]|jgi:heme/copper-type cytochrome/quinol oxidase subunit 3
MTNIRFLPHTRLGVWSGVLFVTFVTLVVVRVVLDAAQDGPDPRMAIPKLATGVALVSTGVVATLAIVRAHERSVTAFAALLIVAIVLGFEIIELLLSL